MSSVATDRLSAKFIYSVIRKRAPMFALVFAALFTIIAIAQYLFVRHGIYKSVEDQLSQSADQIVGEIAFKDKWNLSEYRNTADDPAPSVFVFTSEGLLLETSGFIEGFIGQVKLLDDSIFDGPKTVTAEETGETWRMYAKRVKGGFVVLGILDFQHVNAPDDLLKETASKFGSTIENALKVHTGQTLAEVDYAIIDDSGNLRFEADELPLKMKLSKISELENLHGLVRRGAKLYYLYSRSIVDSSGSVVGTILIPQDVTGEERVIRQHIVFNAFMTLGSWLAALAVVILYLAIEEWHRRPRATSLEEALGNGESKLVEFKEGHADVPLQRALAAFANTNGGTIFLGVNNRAEVVGIDCKTASQKDEELLRIRNITTQAIKPTISVHTDFIIHQEKTVLRIFVPRGEQPLYFLNHEIYVREQTSSMKASPEQVEGILTRFYG